MKKTIMALIISIICANAFSGSVGLPTERLALPEVQGNHLVCIWDDTAGGWLIPPDDNSYDHAGTYEFEVPAWGKWYWIGLWDEQTGEYVFGKWIGHFITE